jgi:hypothetical protein
VTWRWFAAKVQFGIVDALRRDDVARARRATDSERLAQALDAAAAGIALKRRALCLRYPAEADQAIDARLRRWLREPRQPQPGLEARGDG